jgi:pyruvate kinase
MGRPLRPAVIQFVAADRALRPEEPGAMVDATLVAPIGWIRRRRIHERLTLRDTRGARRLLRVESRSGDQLLVTTEKATYFTNGLQLQGRSVRGRKDSTSVEGVEPRPGRIRLAPGDRLLLRPDPAPGRDRVPGGRGRHAFASIGVSHPRLLGRVRPGDQVWFDSGRIGGVARSTSRAGVVVEVVRAPPAGTWLRADQGINLPDTDLRLPSLTEEDRAILPFIVRHADLVGFSFVQSAQGVEALRDELRRLGRPRMGIVLKIETRRAFDKLPAILLSALRHGPAGVMVARGDLAVEVGFERLAEVQEEILWLCEAAHLPAIWATQVLEGLAKSGIPSRAEVTDAAMGERAECVMLNKGPFLIPAVRALDGIVRRMQAHQAKKSARLRHLNVAERFLESTSIPGEAIVTTNEGR